MNESAPSDPGGETLRRLFAEARRLPPFGGGTDSRAGTSLGFETRLRASLRELSREPLGLLAERFAAFSWRFSCVSLPLLLGLAAFLAAQHGASLPEGIGGIVAHWSELLVVEL